IEAASGITVGDDSYTSKVSTFLSVKSPGILSNDSDGKGYPLTVAPASINGSGANPIGPCPAAPADPTPPCVSVDKTGALNAYASASATPYTFTYQAQNSQGTLSSSSATVSLTFLAGNGPAVSVKDPVSGDAIPDYRWIIEEDRTFYIDPNNTTNTGAA